MSLNLHFFFLIISMKTLCLLTELILTSLPPASCHLLEACWEGMTMCQAMYMLRMIKIHVVQGIGWNLCQVTAGVAVSSGRKVAQCVRVLATEIYVILFHRSFILKSVICTCFNNSDCQLWQSKLGGNFWKTFNIFHQYYNAVYSPAWNTNEEKMQTVCHLQR